jgi:hypothetical protein
VIDMSDAIVFVIQDSMLDNNNRRTFGTSLSVNKRGDVMVRMHGRLVAIARSGQWTRVYADASGMSNGVTK